MSLVFVPLIQSGPNAGKPAAKWKREPYTGAPPPADQVAAWVLPPGILVVDVDQHAGGADGWTTLVKLGGCPDTLSYWSRSRKGKHFVFRTHRQVDEAVALHPGVDIKAHGGLVFVPADARPAIMAADLGALPWAPDWAYPPGRTRAKLPAGRATPSECVIALAIHTNRVREATCERNKTLNREAFTYALFMGDASEGAQDEFIQAGMGFGDRFTEAYCRDVVECAMASGLARRQEEQAA